MNARSRTVLTRCSLLTPALALVLASTVPAASAQTTVDVTAPDGVHLATDVWSFGWSPGPTVLMRTPYGRGGLAETCLLFALDGLRCVAQDVRGTGDSGGGFVAFRTAAVDGAATVEWISEQPWSDGRIAAFGPSALGIAGLLLAPRAPELDCVMPIVATGDLRRSIVGDGVLRLELAREWLADRGGEELLPAFSEFRDDRSWWDPLDATDADASQVRAAGFHVGGWWDPFLEGTLDTYRAFQERGGAGARGRQRLLIGPWTHTGVGTTSAGELSYPGAAWNPVTAVAGWLDRCFDDRSEPPPVRVWVMGPPQEGSTGWLDLRRWPPATRPLDLYATAGGALAPRLSTTEPSGATELVIDPLDPVPTVGGRVLHPDLPVDGGPIGSGPRDQRPIESRDDVLVFTSAPLERPLTVVGTVSATVWVEPDTADLDLAVRLTDVWPDGRSMLVVDGIARASTRCGVSGGCSIESGRATPIRIEIGTTAQTFAAGHRIRMVVAGSNHPRFELNPTLAGTDGGPTVVDGIARASTRCGVSGGCSLQAGRATPIRIEVGTTAQTFAAGHRIRMIVAGSNHPRFELNPTLAGTDGGPTVVARPLLLTGPDAPSRLELPVLADPTVHEPSARRRAGARR